MAAVLAADFAQDLIGNGSRLATHTHAAADFVLDAMSSNLELNSVVALGGSLGAHDDLTALAVCALLLQLGCQGLVAGAHHVAKRGLELADEVRLSDVDVEHDEAQPLVLLETVVDLERALEIRIQIIFDHLGLASLDPVPPAVVPLVEVHGGVTLREGVQVLELAARNEERHLHGHGHGWRRHWLNCLNHL